ncbi:MAG: MarR family winged helix-turn-helix transcriptional regulator [Rubrobacteraceae bacterium]
MEGERARLWRPETSGAAEEARADLVALGLEMGGLTSGFAAATGLHPTDVRALWILAEPDAPRTAGELGVRLDLSSGAATRTVDRLESAGYVERVRDPDDRRRVGLRLTGEADAVTGAFFGRVSSVVGETIEDFTEPELVVVARFLSQIHEAMRQSRD